MSPTDPRFNIATLEASLHPVVPAAPGCVLLQYRGIDGIEPLRLPIVAWRVDQHGIAYPVVADEISDKSAVGILQPDGQVVELSGSEGIYDNETAWLASIKKRADEAAKRQARMNVPPPDPEGQPAAAVEAPNGAGTAPAGMITASGHEIISALLGGLRAGVQESMGIAMAALMLKKSRDKVTPEEADSALHNALKISDPVQRAEVIRAGDTAMLSILSWQGIVPTAYAGDLIAGFSRLDAGEREDLGVLTPSPTSRRDPGVTAARERTVSAEVAFQMGRHNTSRDRAIQVTTGVGRGNWTSTQPPTLPWMADYQVIQRAVDAGWRDNSGLKEDAMAQGRKLYRGEKPDPEFLACRRAYLEEWKRAMA